MRVNSQQRQYQGLLGRAKGDYLSSRSVQLDVPLKIKKTRKTLYESSIYPMLRIAKKFRKINPKIMVPGL